MKKLEIVGIGNEDTFNYLLVRKSKDFFKVLRKIMHTATNNMDKIGIEEFEDKQGHCDSREKKISKCVDTHDHYSGGGTRVDLFYGKSTVFIVIHTPLEMREKIMDNFEKYSSIIKVKKIN